MSLNSILSIARSALTTQQRALDVTGHNIANATTPGYTRQRLELVAATPFRTAQGTIGRGVADYGVFANRNSFLDATVRREEGNLGRANTLRDLLGEVESVFGEPSDSGLGATLDAFFSAFSDLANDPSSLAARSVVRQAGGSLIQQVGLVASRLDAVAADTTERTRQAVDQINSIATQIGELNRDIVVQGGPNRTAPDLEDRRGQLLDELATLIQVRVIERPDNTVGVIAGDTLLVDGKFAQQLEVRTLVGGGIGVGAVGSPRLIDPVGGALAGLTALGQQAIPSIRGELDRLVSGLVTEVNALHSAGFTTGGATGVNFFDPTGLTAGAFRLSTDVAASAANVVAGTTAAAGDNRAALALAGLRTTAIGSLNSSTPGEFYNALVTTVGSLVADADREASVAGTLLDSATSRRSSETGVSTDEELVQLIVQQQAYAAATRLVTVANSMMDDLLRMV
jgi:flagellar hook-associated protein 1 FlgK